MVLLGGEVQSRLLSGDDCNGGRARGGNEHQLLRGQSQVLIGITFCSHSFTCKNHNLSQIFSNFAIFTL